MTNMQSQDSVFLDFLQNQVCASPSLQSPRSPAPRSPGQQQSLRQSSTPSSSPSPGRSTIRAPPPSLTRHDTAAASTTTALKALVAAHRIHAQRQGVLQANYDRQALQHMSDAAVMESRLAQLSRASAVLRDVVSHSDTLALRFKDVSAKQTVPVENEFQPHFSSLMAHAAADGSVLQQGRNAAEWALQFQEPPSQWEQHLAPLDSVQCMCSAYQGSISKYRAASTGPGRT